MDREWVFLQDVVTQDEYTLIENILAQEGIPVLKKSPGAGAYLEVVMGSIMLGTGHKLYVPANYLGKAQDILMKMEIEVTPPYESDAYEINDFDEVGSGFIMKYKDLFKKIFIILLLLNFAIPLIMYLINNMIKGTS